MTQDCKATSVASLYGAFMDHFLHLKQILNYILQLCWYKDECALGWIHYHIFIILFAFPSDFIKNLKPSICKALWACVCPCLLETRAQSGPARAPGAAPTPTHSVPKMLGQRVSWKSIQEEEGGGWKPRTSHKGVSTQGPGLVRPVDCPGRGP